MNSSTPRKPAALRVGLARRKQLQARLLEIRRSLAPRLHAGRHAYERADQHLAAALSDTLSILYEVLS